MKTIWAYKFVDDFLLIIKMVILGIFGKMDHTVQRCVKIMFQYTVGISKRKVSKRAQSIENLDICHEGNSTNLYLKKTKKLKKSQSLLDIILFCSFIWNMMKVYTKSITQHS